MGATRRVTQHCTHDRYVNNAAIYFGCGAELLPSGSTHPRFAQGSQTFDNGYPVYRVAEATDDWSDHQCLLACKRGLDYPEVISRCSTYYASVTRILY